MADTLHSRHSWSNPGLKPAPTFSSFDTASEPGTLNDERLYNVTEDSRLQADQHVAAISESVQADIPSEEDLLDAWNRKNVLSLGALVLFPQAICLLTRNMRKDGGGIRALSALYFLEILMEEITSIEGETKTSSIDSPLPYFQPDGDKITRALPIVRGMQGRYLPCHYFDYIGGAGIGG